MTLIASTCIRVVFLIQSFFSSLSFEIVLEELEVGVLGFSSFLPKRVLFNPSLERRISFCGVSRPILTSSAIIALSSLV